MDIEKPQRKTVQWNAEEMSANVLNHQQEFKKKVLEFDSVKSKLHEEVSNSSSDEESMEEKSQKTIEMQQNLKKAKVNRISLGPGKINLKEINRRISLKENTNPMDEEDDMDEQARAKKAEFEKKKQKFCNEGFGLRKNH